MSKIVILGAGESGAGAAVLAKKEGFEVFVSDMSKIKDNYKKLMDDHNIEWEEGHHTEEKILDADEVIKSPGIPKEAPMVQKLMAKGTPIISEIEFAGRYTDAKMICITGSNGKTTTTSLIYHIIKSAGYDVGLAGNIGKSLALQVAETPHKYYVIELSSFQLDNMYEFRANVAILLNITPDHLDRYEFKMQNYTDAKMRITQNLQVTMVFPGTGTFTDFAITIQVFIHDISSRPLRTDCILTAMRQCGKMVVHLFLRLSDAGSLKSPDNTGFLTRHICTDRACLVAGIAVYISCLVGKRQGDAVIQSIVQTIFPRE